MSATFNLPDGLSVAGFPADDPEPCPELGRDCPEGYCEFCWDAGVKRHSVHSMDGLELCPECLAVVVMDSIGGMPAQTRFLAAVTREFDASLRAAERRAA